MTLYKDMPQLVKPASKTKVKLVPRDGELEITLNISITVDGQVSSIAPEIAALKAKEEEDKVDMLIPDFGSGLKVDFGKEEK